MDINTITPDAPVDGFRAQAALATPDYKVEFVVIAALD